MPAATSFTQLESVADQIGAAGALRLFTFFGSLGGGLYVPVIVEDDHILSKLLGRKAFSDLVAAFGGQTLHCTRLDLGPLRTAARVWALSKRNLSNQMIAGLLGITAARVSQISRQLREEGFGDLEDHILLAGDELEAA